jgi:hypothetical protein
MNYQVLVNAVSGQMDWNYFRRDSVNENIPVAFLYAVGRKFCYFSEPEE